jgi:hypothetical protein
VWEPIRWAEAYRQSLSKSHSPSKKLNKLMRTDESRFGL